jgi:ubiquinone biosynthesis accessory factor UbiK
MAHGSHCFGASGRSSCIHREQDLTGDERLSMLHASSQGTLMDPKIIDDLARRLAGSVPESLQALKRDLETNFKAVLQSGLARLDLVTRSEFDVQAAVLRRTREKIEALEARIRELEAETQK